MEGLKIVKVESIKEDGIFNEGISYEQYDNVCDTYGENENVERLESINEEANFSEDATYEQYNTIVIDSEEENDNAETIIPEMEANFISENNFYSMKVENTYNNQIEHINIQNSEGNEFQECKYIPYIQEDPLAFDSSIKSSVMEDMEDDAEYILPQTCRPFCDISYSVALQDDQEQDIGIPNLRANLNSNEDPPDTITPNTNQNEDSVKKCDFTPTSSSSVVTFTAIISETEESRKIKFRTKPKLQSVSDMKDPTGNSRTVRKRRINILQKEKNECSKCGESFTTSEALLLHIDTHAVDMEVPSECSDPTGCSRTVRKRRINILQKRSNRCSKCGKGFLTSEELLEHIDTHAVGKLYFCQALVDGSVVLNLTES